MIRRAADPNSYGFRPERSTADAIEKCFDVLSRKTSSQWIYEGDIKGCFDNISHKWMEEHIPMDRQILRKWLKAGYMEKSSFHPTETGTPQGGIISPTLMNMVLDGLEAKIREKFPRRKCGHSKWKVHFIRYADDFIITGDSKELLEKDVRPLVEGFLEKRGLEISVEKTSITHIDDGFDFLGQTFRKHKGKLLVKPSVKSQKAFRRNIREVMEPPKAAPHAAVIGALNPIIRGWGNYHSHAVSKKVFNSMDHWIFGKVWKWARRRHPDKPKKWVKERYFTAVGSQDWIFQASKEVVKGRIRTKKPLCRKNGSVRKQPYPTLLNMSAIPIRRHIKIKCDANPFDPAWRQYLERRANRKTRLSPSSIM